MDRTIQLSLHILATLGLAGSVLIAVAAPADAAPAITVSPSGQIADGSEVELKGSGFVPGTTVGAAQCSSEVLTSLDIGDCDLTNFGIGRIGDNGRVSLTLTAFRYFKGADGPIDCAEEGACLVGIGPPNPVISLDASAFTELDFDPNVATHEPLEVTTALRSWTARTATVAVTCSRPVRVGIGADLLQERPAQEGYTWPRAFGHRSVRCAGSTVVTVPMEPRQREGRGGVIYPYRRLKRGPAVLTIGTEAGTGRWRVYNSDDYPVEVTEPDLTRARHFTSKHVDVRFRGLRVTTSGRAVAKAEVTCDRERRSVAVRAQVVAPAPGATYRSAQGWASVGSCDERPRVVTIPLNDDAAAFPSYRSDIVPAGPLEAYVTAEVAYRRGSTDMRQFTTRRDMRPATIRVRPDPQSRLRIGPVSTDSARASFRCRRTVPFSVIAVVGQPVGDVVFNNAGRALVDCVAGRTVVFDIDWFGGLRPDHRAAVSLFAVNGTGFPMVAPWQQTQGAWRTPR